VVLVVAVVMSVFVIRHIPIRALLGDIEKWEQKDPYDVDEMPVNPGQLNPM
jgi:hypothetical protein